MSLLQLKLLQITDTQIRRCLEELALVSNQDISGFENMMLLHGLDMCLHPNGPAEKGVSISRRLLDSHDPTDSFLLRTKVGKLEDPMHQVCQELSSLRGRNVDEFGGTALHLFLNRVAVSKKPRIVRKSWKLNWQIDSKTGR